MKSKSTSRVRGSAYVGYLAAVAAIAIPIAAALVYVAAPTLSARFRADQRALASPMP
jgi:hypothetical protein